LATDPQVLGILAWAATAITLLGFGITIWQLIRTRQAADAAHRAAIGLARRVRSREVLIQLSNAHSHLEAARSRVISGGHEAATLCLELSIRAIIEAREASREAAGPSLDLQALIARLSYAIERLQVMSDPLQQDPDFMPFLHQLRREAEILQRHLAQLRYRYDVDEVQDDTIH
jgi:hypothetical protein